MADDLAALGSIALFGAGGAIGHALCAQLDRRDVAPVYSHGPATAHEHPACEGAS